MVKVEKQRELTSAFVAFSSLARSGSVVDDGILDTLKTELEWGLNIISTQREEQQHKEIKASVLKETLQAKMNKGGKVNVASTVSSSAALKKGGSKIGNDFSKISNVHAYVSHLLILAYDVVTKTSGLREKVSERSEGVINSVALFVASLLVGFRSANDFAPFQTLRSLFYARCSTRGSTF